MTHYQTAPSLAHLHLGVIYSLGSFVAPFLALLLVEVGSRCALSGLLA